jgi:hypothetical protein
MPIVQISRIQHRRGKRTDLPQLAAGELGWVIDEQRLFIGNGTVADGAPAVGNTEIITAGSSAFTTALSHTYKGYLGDSTPVATGASSDITRTLQAVLDDYASVKSFDAKGDNSTDDTAAIQRALDELYSDTDQDDTRARRTLFFPAGIYKITSALTIPPYAHLLGEGPDKTIISNSGATNAVAVFEDDDGQGFGSIGNSGATTPTQMQFDGITFKNTVAYGGVSIDNATKVYFNNCKFEGSFASGGSDNANSKGITVRSTTALPSSQILFNQCQFTKFARLIDLSYDVDSVKFNDCDFSVAYYGALLGEQMDGSSNGLTVGPRDIQFNSNSWSTIGQQAIYVKLSSETTGTGTRNVISTGNFFAKTVANNFEGIGTLNEVPVIQYDNDECSSHLDFFERSDLRRSDGSSHMNAAPEIQGIGIQDKAIKSFTLANNQSATTINEYPALAGKGLRIKYKIVRNTLDRTGELVVSASTNGISHDDTYTESGDDCGVTLTAELDDKDSTSGNETVVIKMATTDATYSATIDYQTTIIA